MRAQQVVTELAIKGDTALDGMRPVEEAPSWAALRRRPARGAAQRLRRLRRGRSTTPRSGTPPTSATRPGRTNGHHAPALGIVGEAGATASVTPDALPGYETMTIAQLRGKLRALSIEQVTELLAWEPAHADRPPFVTMLSNRITTLSQQG